MTEGKAAFKPEATNRMTVPGLYKIEKGKMKIIKHKSIDVFVLGTK